MDDKRLLMSHENLEMVIYLKYWYDVEERQQNNLRKDESSSSDGEGSVNWK